MADSPKKKEQDFRELAADIELENGVFKLGQKYHIRTPTYQYLGELAAVTGTVFVFKNTATVYETGPYPKFYKGEGSDIQQHSGAGQMVVDRAGTVLHEVFF